MIVASANCEPLDKRLLICHFIPTKAKTLGLNFLLSFLIKVLFLTFFTGQSRTHYRKTMLESPSPSVRLKYSIFFLC